MTEYMNEDVNEDSNERYTVKENDVYALVVLEDGREIKGSCYGIINKTNNIIEMETRILPQGLAFLNDITRALVDITTNKEEIDKVNVVPIGSPIK